MPEINPGDYHRRYVRLHRVVGAAILFVAIVGAIVAGKLIEDARWGGREPWPIAENRPLPTSAQTQDASQTQTAPAPPAPPAPLIAEIVPPGDLHALEPAIRAAIENVRPAVVRIRSAVRANVHPASGTIISPTGLILTAAHVITQFGAMPLTPTVRVELADGRTFSARPLGGNREGDYALLKIDGLAGEQLPWVVVGDPARAVPGEWVLTIGHGPNFAVGAELGTMPAVRVGRLNGETVMASWVHEADGWRLLVCDAPILPGDSGGAVVALDGKLLGIVSGIGPDAENLSPARRAFGFNLAARIDAVMADQSRLLRSEWYGQRLMDLCCSPRGFATALPGRSIAWTPNIWGREWLGESEPATRGASSVAAKLAAEPAIVAAWRSTVIVRHKGAIVGNGVVMAVGDGQSLIVCGPVPGRSDLTIAVPTSMGDALALVPAEIAGMWGPEKFAVLHAPISHVPALEFSTAPVSAGAVVVAVARGESPENPLQTALGVVAVDASRDARGAMVVTHDAILPASGMGGALVTLDGRIVGVNLRAKSRVTWQAISAAELQAAFADRLREGH